ncbi:MAG: hypothetical protein HY823_06835 [Acidobacteria bacterium]|nr:hypothetical protein [Acidobacteriota bacterium]
MPVDRLKITSIVVTFEDGSTFTVPQAALDGPRGGALFWNEHAVSQVLTAFYKANPGLPTSPADVAKKWNAPLANGRQPSLLIKMDCSPVPGP